MDKVNRIPNIFHYFLIKLKMMTLGCGFGTEWIRNWGGFFWLDLESFSKAHKKLKSFQKLVLQRLFLG
jgi:hypothetical protein